MLSQLKPRQWLVLLVCTCFVVVPSAAQPSIPAALAEAVRLAAEAELVAQRTPGVSVAVVWGETLVYSAGFGVRNTETKDPVTPDTLFQIGSTTKPLTALAALRLASEGVLDLDAPVQTVLPELDMGQYTDLITMRALLSHTAGINDAANDQGPRDPQALRASLSEYGEASLFAMPGMIHSYSNPGFDLAGAVIEQVSGRYYADYMTEKIFRPLGMLRTTFDPAVAMTYPLAAGYSPGLFGPLPVRPLSFNMAEAPSGLAYSSANDLIPLMRVLIDPPSAEVALDVIGSPLLDDMTEPTTTYTGAVFGYGLGVFIDDYEGNLMLGHNGAINGYRAFLQVLPGRQFGVVVLANNIAFDAQPIFDAAYDTVFPEVLPSRTPVPTPYVPEPEALEEYVGRYVVRDMAGAITIAVEVRLQDGVLTAQPSGQPQLILQPTKPDEFAVFMGQTDLDLPLTFARTSDKVIRYLNVGYRSAVREEDVE